MRTYTTPWPVVATVQVAGARVRVTASDRADTAVLVEPVDAARPLDVKVANRIKVDLAGDRLSVRTTAAGVRTGSVAVTIDLPTGSDLVAYLANSDVETLGPVGECELHMAKGRVQLDRVAALQATVTAGEVAVAQVAGTADITGSPRELRIGEIEGVLRHEGSTGRIRIGRAGSDVELRIAGGSVDIDRAEGSVIVTSAKCPIRIGRMTRGAATLANASGNIELGVGDGIAAVVDARSMKGTVRSLLPAGSRSDPAIVVHARTRHGDVIVGRAARQDVAASRGGAAAAP